jgi:hypothetical protein
VAAVESGAEVLHQLQRIMIPKPWYLWYALWMSWPYVGHYIAHLRGSKNHAEGYAGTGGRPVNENMATCSKALWWVGLWMRVR